MVRRRFPVDTVNGNKIGDDEMLLLYIHVSHSIHFVLLHAIA